MITERGYRRLPKNLKTIGNFKSISRIWLRSRAGPISNICKASRNIELELLKWRCSPSSIWPRSWKIKSMCLQRGKRAWTEYRRQGFELKSYLDLEMLKTLKNRRIKILSNSQLICREKWVEPIWCRLQAWSKIPSRLEETKTIIPRCRLSLQLLGTIPSCTQTQTTTSYRSLAKTQLVAFSLLRTDVMTREIQTMAWTAETSWMWAKRLISMTPSTALILWARRSQREERGSQIQLPRVRLAWTAKILNHLMPEWPKSQNTISLPPSAGMMTPAWKRSSKHTRILTLSRCWMLDPKHQ